MTDEPRIFMRHVRALNLCSNGLQRLSERLGVPMQDFLQNGYPCSLAEQSGNPFVRKAAALARAEWEEKHGKV